MNAAPLPANEAERLARLRLYGILDTPPEEAFNRIVRIASQLLDVPIALVSLVDEARQWFKARIGLQASETPRDLAFCAHAILGDDVFVVEDASAHEDFRDNPLVTNDPSIRFYAGAPLTTHAGFKLGTVCIIDRKPRQLSDAQRRLLKDLSALAVDEMELRTAGRMALAEVAERTRIDQFKTAFISTVNHEIRTPLTSIIGGLGLVNSGALGDVPASMTEVLAIAERNSSLLLRLINELLDSAKLDAGQMEFHMSRIDIANVTREAVENLRDYGREKDIAVTGAAHAPLHVHADKARLAQVMNNLISNAIKFSPPKSEVRVSVEKRGLKAVVSVSDTGGGIPAALQPRIFEKFVQGHAAGKTPMDGTGLGLSIAKAIVESHGGEIGFETVAGAGTRFYFTLPVI